MEQPTAASSSQTASPLDPAFLSYLRELWDPEDPRFLTDLLATFLADAENRVRTMHGALAAEDAQGLACAAHALKGASASIGAEAVARICERLTSFRSAPWTARTGELVREVEEALARVKADVEQLDRWLPLSSFS